jgi:hypothetical protein
MNLSEALDIRGQLTLQKRDARDRLIDVIHAQNSIVLTGRELVAKLFIKEVKDTIKPVSHVAVGTGTAAVSPQDSKLATELFRKAINPIDVGRDLQSVEQADGSIRKKVMITADLDLKEAIGGLTEAALFTGDPKDTSAVMYNRVVFPVINKSADFKLTLIWEILF